MSRVVLAQHPAGAGQGVPAEGAGMLVVLTQPGQDSSHDAGCLQRGRVVNSAAVQVMLVDLFKQRQRGAPIAPAIRGRCPALLRKSR